MANIDNKLGTNGAYGGRTSVEAFNDVLSAFNGSGVLSGWKAEPVGGLSVFLGGDGENRDVAIALDNQGNKITVNNISKQPITITLPSAPASGTRKDNIVAYIDKPVQADDTTLDNPSAVNIFITSADTDNAIRSAITQDGGAGTNAFYVILASVNLSAGTTDITADMIRQGTRAKIGSENIDLTNVYLFETGTPITTTEITKQQWTAPADGDYLILSTNSFHQTQTKSASYLTIYQNTTIIATSYITQEASSWANLNYNMVAKNIKAGDVLKFSFRNTVGITQSTNTKLRQSIIKIG